MQTDPEDSHMLESSSESDDEAMFPSEFDAPTLTLQYDPGPLGIQPPGLSPPQSQDLHDTMDTAEGTHEMNGVDQLMDAAQGTDQSNDNGWEPKSEFAKSAEMAHEPGSCWNNKKAREEWQKAWNQVEDKNFSLSEYSTGDGRDGGNLPIFCRGFW